MPRPRASRPGAGVSADTSKPLPAALRPPASRTLVGLGLAAPSTPPPSHPIPRTSEPAPAIAAPGIDRASEPPTPSAVDTAPFFPAPSPAVVPSVLGVAARPTAPPRTESLIELDDTGPSVPPSAPLDPVAFALATSPRPPVAIHPARIAPPVSALATAPGVGPAPVVPEPVPAPRPRRHRALFVLAAVTAVLVGGAGAVWSARRLHLSSLTPRARRLASLHTSVNPGASPDASIHTALSPEADRDASLHTSLYPAASPDASFHTTLSPEADRDASIHTSLYPAVSPDASIHTSLTPVAVPPVAPPPATTGAVQPGYPTARSVAAIERVLGTELLACREGHGRHARIAVVYDGATGHVASVDVASPLYAAEPVHGCIERAVRSHPVGPFSRPRFTAYFHVLVP